MTRPEPSIFRTVPSPCLYHFDGLTVLASASKGRTLIRKRTHVYISIFVRMLGLNMLRQSSQVLEPPTTVINRASKVV